jgi:hypothetical protein
LEFPFFLKKNIVSHIPIDQILSFYSKFQSIQIPSRVLILLSSKDIYWNISNRTIDETTIFLFALSCTNTINSKQQRYNVGEIERERERESSNHRQTEANKSGSRQ